MYFLSIYFALCLSFIRLFFGKNWNPIFLLFDRLVRYCWTRIFWLFLICSSLPILLFRTCLANNAASFGRVGFLFISHRLSSCFKKPLSGGQLLRRCLGRRRCSAALIARKNIFHAPGWRTIIPSVKSFPMALSKINMREDTLVHTVHRSSVGEFTAHN